MLGCYRKHLPLGILLLGLWLGLGVLLVGGTPWHVFCGSKVFCTPFTYRWYNDSYVEKFIEKHFQHDKTTLQVGNRFSDFGPLFRLRTFRL